MPGLFRDRRSCDRFRCLEEYMARLNRYRAGQTRSAATSLIECCAGIALVVVRWVVPRRQSWMSKARCGVCPGPNPRPNPVASFCPPSIHRWGANQDIGNKPAVIARGRVAENVRLQRHPSPLKISGFCPSTMRDLVTSLQDSSCAPISFMERRNAAALSRRDGREDRAQPKLGSCSPSLPDRGVPLESSAATQTPGEFVTNALATRGVFSRRQISLCRHRFRRSGHPRQASGVSDHVLTAISV